MRLLLALALLLVPLASAAPEQVHLGLRDPDYAQGITVSWLEMDPQGPDFVTLTGPESEARIDARAVPGHSPGIVYEARFPPLAEGASYAYAIGERSFALAPPPASNFTFAALGDMGTTREAGATVETLRKASPSFVIHSGDISYAEGDPTLWKAWFTLVEPVAASSPWIPALGNHEGDVLGLARDEAAVVDPAEQAIVKQRFPLPRETFWYSFDVQGVHFVALDTFSQLTMPQEEVEWLEADLAAAKDARFIVVFLHEPPYSSNAAHGSSPRAYGAFAAILEEAGVDLVLAAHDHSYERTHLLRGGDVVSVANESARGNGTRYVVTGGAGAALYESFVAPQPEWSAVREAIHHVLLVTVEGSRLTVRAVATEDGRVVDEFSIGSIDEASPLDEVARTPAGGAGLLAVAMVVAAFASRRW